MAFKKQQSKQEKITIQVNEFLKPLGYEAIVKIESSKDELGIYPNTRKVGKNRKDYFDGLKIMCWEGGGFEVAEYNSGQKGNQIWVYKETKSLKLALQELIKGNNRKPIKVWK